MVTKNWGAGGREREVNNRYGGSLGGDENLLKLIVLMVCCDYIKLYEYIKNHLIVYFEWVIEWYVNYISLKLSFFKKKILLPLKATGSHWMFWSRVSGIICTVI